MEFTIRKGNEADLPHVLKLIRELATYEHAPQEVTITLEDLKKDGFGDQPLYRFLVAEVKAGIIGISFYYIRYSTWKGRCLYLEDIVVSEAWRGQKVGSALFEATIGAARDMDARLMVWQVLEWNEPALNFYRKYDAELDGEWINGKLNHGQILKLAPAN